MDGWAYMLALLLRHVVVKVSTLYCLFVFNPWATCAFVSMSVYLHSINTQNYYNQEQPVSPIIFIHKPFKITAVWLGAIVSPAPDTIFNRYPQTALHFRGTGQNKWHEEIKPGCSAIFSLSRMSHFHTSCLQGMSRYRWDNWIYYVNVEHRGLTPWLQTRWMVLFSFRIA